MEQAVLGRFMLSAMYFACQGLDNYSVIIGQAICILGIRDQNILASIKVPTSEYN